MARKFKRTKSRSRSRPRAKRAVRRRGRAARSTRGSTIKIVVEAPMAGNVGNREGPLSKRKIF